MFLRQVDAGLFPVLTAADLQAKAQDIVLFAPPLFMHTFLDAPRTREIDDPYVVATQRAVLRALGVE